MFNISSETATTMIRLNCGGFNFVPGHDIAVGDFVTCPDAGECRGCYYSDGEAQVVDVLRTHTATVDTDRYAGVARQLSAL